MQTFLIHFLKILQFPQYLFLSMVLFFYISYMQLDIKIKYYVCPSWKILFGMLRGVFSTAPFLVKAKNQLNSFENIIKIYLETSLVDS